MGTLHLAQQPVIPVVEKRAFADPTTMIESEFVRWTDKKFGIATLRVIEGYRLVRGVKLKINVLVQAKFSPGDTSGGDRVFRTRDGTLYRVPSTH